MSSLTVAKGILFIAVGDELVRVIRPLALAKAGGTQFFVPCPYGKAPKIIKRGAGFARQFTYICRYEYAPNPDVEIDLTSGECRTK